MHQPLTDDPVPQVTAGIMTVECACGWEIGTVSPEEDIHRLQQLIRHFTEAHGIVLPLVRFTNH
jgi:FMN-dependent NADH-azoreductase